MPITPAVAAEGQKSIMSFFKKIEVKGAAPPTPAAGKIKGCAGQSAQAFADLSGATTPPVVKGAGSMHGKCAQQELKSQAATESSSMSPADVKGKRKACARKNSSSCSSRESKRAAPSGRPSRASKSRAQEHLKERDYSSDSLMEESEDETEVAQKGPGSVRDLEVKTPASSSRSGRKVRFSIEGQEDALDKAFGGETSPIAVDDEDECLSDVLNAEKRDAKRAARQRAALDAVEDQLATLQYGKREGTGDNASTSLPACDKGAADKRRDSTSTAANAMEPTATSTNGMNRHKKGSAGVKGSLPRRSSRGSGAAARTSLVKDANEEEKGDKGNIFDLMKVWKKKEEQKEEAAWVHAVVTLEQKIENGEETEVDEEMMVEAEEALKEVSEAEVAKHEDDEEMSSYEKERLANIKRNNAFLLNLGIVDTVQPAVTPKHMLPSLPFELEEIAREIQARPAPKSRRREHSPPTPTSALLTRRSTRAASGDVLLKSKMQELESLEGQLSEYRETGAAEGETEEYLIEQIQHLKTEIAGIEEENAAKRAKLTEDSARARDEDWRGKEEEVELNFDDSSVKRYNCESVRVRVAQADLSKGVRGLAPLEDATYHDSNLKRIYSISFRPCGKLVAAAGHGGMASIFGIGSSGSGGESDDVLLSWKAHQGWIGDIQFVSQQNEDPAKNLLLSVSNDATVVLWDINTAAHLKHKNIPKKVASEAWHASGVFSMHEVGGRIVTGSKDGCVAVAQLAESKLGKVAVLEDILEGHVVKCVRLRPHLSVNAAGSPPSIFACGGNSHTARIVDVREGGGVKGGVTWTAADSAVSFVQWSPADENVLISCSHDTDIKVWDIRQSKQALHSLLGHHQVPRTSRIKGMHRATFFAAGRYVVSTGEKTDLLSIYDVATGVAVSRGAAEGTGTSSAAFEDADCCLVAVAAATSVTLYTPLAVDKTVLVED